MESAPKGQSRGTKDFNPSTIYYDHTKTTERSETKITN